MPAESSAPPRICLAQIGARRHYAVPAMLEDAGLLERLYTDLHSGSGLVRAAAATIPAGLRPAAFTRLLAREIPQVAREKILDFPLFGLRRTLGSRKSVSTAQRYQSYLQANVEFGRLVCERGFGEADSVYIFNGAGLEIARKARQLGLRVILEQTAADQEFEELLLQEERTRWPGWESAEVLEEHWRPLAERETAERDIADLVICGSDYVRQTLQHRGGDAGNSVVVPYGFKDTLAKQPRSGQHRPLRILFAGTLCLRKGVPYLLQMADSLAKERRVQVRVAGPSAIADEKMREVAAVAEYVGTVPRSQMLEHYLWADVFVLPTLSEGSANVCYEALAAGLPVVTTPHAGSVVRDGIEGFIVPIRCADSICERLCQLDDDPTLYEQMSASAIARSREFTWDRYAERLIAAVRQTPAIARQSA